MLILIKLSASLRKAVPDYDRLVGLSLPAVKGEKTSGLLKRLNIPAREVKIVMLNGLAANLDAPVQDGDRVGLFPPVGGGWMTQNLREVLAPYLKENPVPGREPFFSVSGVGIADRALSADQTPVAVMQECLAQDIWPERLRPNRGAFSAGDQARLLGSKAAVIGAGGLGGMVILLLARFGLGGLTVCDGDVFEESNLNRQFLSSLERLGQNKAECAAQEAARVNSWVDVRVVPHHAEPESFPEILEGSQVALDCLDNMPSRYALEQATAQARIPYVHGAIAGLEGFVMTVAPGEPGLRGLYGQKPPEKKDSAEAVMGVPTMTPAAVATLQVNEAVKLILGRRGLGPGRLLHLDLAGPGLEIMDLG